MANDADWIDVDEGIPDMGAVRQGSSGRSKFMLGLAVVGTVVLLSRLFTPGDESQSQGDPVPTTVPANDPSAPTSSEPPMTDSPLVEALELDLLQRRVGLLSNASTARESHLFVLSAAGVSEIGGLEIVPARTEHPFLFDGGLIAYSSSLGMNVINLETGHISASVSTGTAINGSGNGEFLFLSVRSDEVTVISGDDSEERSTTPVAANIATIRYRVSPGFIGVGDVSFAPNRNVLIAYDGFQWAVQRHLLDAGRPVAAREGVVVLLDGSIVKMIDIFSDEIIAQWETGSFAAACLSPELNRIVFVRGDGSGVVQQIGLDSSIFEWGAGSISRNIGWLNQDTLAYIDVDKKSLVVLNVTTGASGRSAALSSTVGSWHMEIEGGSC